LEDIKFIAHIDGDIAILDKSIEESRNVLINNNFVDSCCFNCSTIDFNPNGQDIVKNLKRYDMEYYDSFMPNNFISLYKHFFTFGYFITRKTMIDNFFLPEFYPFNLPGWGYEDSIVSYRYSKLGYNFYEFNPKTIVHLRPSVRFNNVSDSFLFQRRAICMAYKYFFLDHCNIIDLNIKKRQPKILVNAKILGMADFLDKYYPFIIFNNKSNDILDISNIDFVYSDTKFEKRPIFIENNFDFITSKIFGFIIEKFYEKKVEII
jgi:hypothetical protein